MFIDVGLFNECQGNNTCLGLQVGNFVCLSDRAYTHEQILIMEKIILAKLDWTLTVPIPLVFLLRFIKASVPDQEVCVCV